MPVTNSGHVGEKRMKSRVRARFRLTIFALALGTAWGAEAQRAVVRGRVVEENGKPLEGVQILIELLESSARKYTGTSKANGDFVRVGLVTGTYRITCSKEGFVPAILDVPVKGTDNLDVGNVILTKVPEGFVTEEQRAEAQKHLEAAMSSSDQANYQTTIESLKKFLETVPDSPEAHFSLAVAYEKLGDRDNALTYYQKATKLKPDFYEAYVAMGEIYGAGKEWQAGAELLQKALKLRPGERQVLFNWGAYSANAGDLVTAQQAFEKLVQLDPQHALAHYQLGVTFLGQGKNEAAIRHFEQYLEIEPDGERAVAAKEILGQIRPNQED